MPELLKLKDLGNFGVITDLSNDSLPPEIFTSGMNFRLRNGKVETYNGAKSLGYIPVNLYARKIILWIRAGGDKLVIMGNEGVYTFDGVTWIDVTPVDFVTITNLNEWSWSACQSGISIVINNPQIGPYYLNDGVSVATPLPYDATRSWQDIDHSPLIIRSHKEFLIALGNKAFVDGAIDHNQIGWSAPATETGIPFTWDPTDILHPCFTLYDKMALFPAKRF